MVASRCFPHSALSFSSHYLSLTSPYRYLYVTHATRASQSHDLSGEGIKLWITYILFLTTQGHGGPTRLSDQLNAGATSETAQT